MPRKAPQFRRWLTVFALALCLLVWGAGGALADSSDLPPAQTAGTSTDSPPLYDQYPTSAFTLDSAAHFSDPAWKGTHLITDVLMGFKSWGVQLSIRTAEYALDGTLWDPLAQFSESSMQTLHQQLWQADHAPWIVGALSFIGLAALAAWAAGKATGALHLLAGTVLILMLSYATVVVVPGSTTALEELARAASTQTFTAVAAATGSQNSAGLIRSGGATLFRNLVYEPWVAFEFTDRSTAVRYGSVDLPGQQLLAKTPQQRAQVYRALNSDAARQVSFAPWSEDGVVPRMVMAIWTAIAASLAAGSVLLLAGGILVQQVLLLVLVALLPVWLLLALWWPGGGLRVLRRVLTLGVGALVLQAVLAVTLAVNLSLVTAAGTVLTTLGWSTLALVLAVIGVAAYRYRYAWLDAGSRSGNRIVHQVLGRAAALNLTRTGAEHGGAQAGPNDAAAAIPTFAAIHGRAMESGALTGGRAIDALTREYAGLPYPQFTAPARETGVPTAPVGSDQGLSAQRRSPDGGSAAAGGTPVPARPSLARPVRAGNEDAMEGIPRQRPKPQ